MPLWSKTPSHELVTQMPTSFQEESPGTPQPQHEMSLESSQSSRRVRLVNQQDNTLAQVLDELRTSDVFP
jgi:hypothetical protein